MSTLRGAYQNSMSPKTPQSDFLEEAEAMPAESEGYVNYEFIALTTMILF